MTTTTEPTSDRTEAETIRMSQRQAVKRRIAELELRQKRVDELRRVITSINEKTDAAADAHHQKCEPLQAELAKLHDKQLDQIATKAEPNKADEKKRFELLQQVADENAELEKVVAANRATITKIESEIKELLEPSFHESQNITTLENNKLCGELARPEWRNRSFAMRERLVAMNSYIGYTQSQCEKFRAVLNNQEAYIAHDVRRAELGLARWQAAVADAEQLAAEARSEADDLRDRMMSE